MGLRVRWTEAQIALIGLRPIEGSVRRTLAMPLRSLLETDQSDCRAAYEASVAAPMVVQMARVFADLPLEEEERQKRKTGRRAVAGGQAKRRDSKQTSLRVPTKTDSFAIRARSRPLVAAAFEACRSVEG